MADGQTGEDLAKAREERRRRREEQRRKEEEELQRLAEERERRKRERAERLRGLQLEVQPEERIKGTESAACPAEPETSAKVEEQKNAEGQEKERGREEQAKLKELEREREQKCREEEKEREQELEQRRKEEEERKIRAELEEQEETLRRRREERENRRKKLLEAEQAREVEEKERERKKLEEEEQERRKKVEQEKREEEKRKRKVDEELEREREERRREEEERERREEKEQEQRRREEEEQKIREEEEEKKRKEKEEREEEQRKREKEIEAEKDREERVKTTGGNETNDAEIARISKQLEDLERRRAERKSKRAHLKKQLCDEIAKEEEEIRKMKDSRRGRPSIPSSSSSRKPPAARTEETKTTRVSTSTRPFANSFLAQDKLEQERKRKEAQDIEDRLRKNRSSTPSETTTRPSKQETEKVSPSTTTVSSAEPGKDAGTFRGRDCCLFCGKKVYAQEEIKADEKSFHKSCFRCAQCKGLLKLGTYASLEGKYYCKPHFKQLFKTKGNYASGFGTETPEERWKKRSGIVASDPPSSPSPGLSSAAETRPEGHKSVSEELEELRKRAADKKRVEAPNSKSAAALDQEEQAALLAYFNTVLKGDKNPNLVAKLKRPVSVENLATILNDGTLLCKFLERMLPEAQLDERTITWKIADEEDVKGNWNLCINSGLSAGVRVRDLKISDLCGGDVQTLSRLIWEIIKAKYAEDIRNNVSRFEDQIRRDDDGTSDVSFLPLEIILLRWVNYHLEQNGGKSVTNLGEDLKDSVALATLLHALSPSTCSLDVLRETDLEKRAEAVLASAAKAGYSKTIATVKGLLMGNERAGLSFVAQLFTERVN